ncbi:MAG: hypothetical protein WC341_16885, partial [Bacteroidales bacterium]
MKKTATVLFLFGAISLLFLVGNIFVEQGGPLDNAIVKKSDSFYKMAQEALQLKIETGGMIRFVRWLPEGGITKEIIAEVMGCAEILKHEFSSPRYAVLGLSEIAQYRLQDDEMQDAPYFNDGILHDEKFNGNKWLADVKHDSNVYDFFIGKNYVQILLLLPTDANEMKIFWHMVEVLRGRKLIWWEKIFYKFNLTDISCQGKFAHFRPVGWPLARGLMQVANITDLLRTCTAGLIVAFFAAWVSLGSWKQAAIVTLLINLSFIWTRGLMGWLLIGGLPVYERIYTLLVAAVQIVAGISFGAHKFNAYNSHVGLSITERWKKAEYVNEIILLTGAISAVGFVQLGMSIPIRQIGEIAGFSAFGIVSLVFMSIYLQPHLHMIIGGEAKDNVNSVSGRWHRKIDDIVNWCRRMSLRPHAVRKSLVQLAVFFLIPFCLILLDYTPGFSKSFQFLKTGTNPYKYIEGASMERTARRLNGEGMPGSDIVPVALQNTRDVSAEIALGYRPIEDPLFLDHVREFSHWIKQYSYVRRVNSILDTFNVIQREDEIYRDDIADTEAARWQKNHEMFSLVDWNLQESSRWLYSDNSIVVSLSNTGNDSNALGEALDACVSARESGKFDNVKIIIYTVLGQWPRMDDIVCLGKVWNILTSPFGLMI